MSTFQDQTKRCSDSFFDPDELQKLEIQKAYFKLNFSEWNYIESI